MAFTDFSSIDTLTKLDAFLKDKSYIEGAAVSQADVTTYQAFQKAYPNFTRWFNHIASFTEEFESLPAAKEAAPAAAAAAEEEDDDDVDLFGEDDEEEDDEEAAKVRAQRIAEYEKKKADKPKAAAKSLVSLDVKPWDDETDMDALLKFVKSIEMEGLTWGSYQFVPVGYGIRKLQINCVVVDDLVALDDLQEAIEAGDDWVQSTDIAAMSKL
ncbi:DEKNAAC100181 [Brettanomyces naardenensis]|uniref:DEKNAAC100181 n=1 Tax=Brettanomyces naardenensis TaxID=13370 RepID=A0A448YFH7_BRENA|nr:DEKNAAC100181 [Brettanomyces naardenensis]